MGNFLEISFIFLITICHSEIFIVIPQKYFGGSEKFVAFAVGYSSMTIFSPEILMEIAKEK